MKLVKSKDEEIYQVITKAMDKNNKNSLVIYQEMKPPYRVLATSEEDFLQMLSEEEKQDIQKDVFTSEDFMKEEKAQSSLVEEFLNEDSYKKKIQLLLGRADEITETKLELLAVTEDVILDGKTLEEKCDSLLQALRMKARFYIER